MNEQLFQLVNQYAGQSVWLDGTMIFFAEYTPIVFALFLLMLWFSSKRKDILEKNQRTALYTVLVFLLCLAVNQIIHLLYWHPRPFLVHDVNQLVGHAGKESSFASEHTMLAFSIAGTFFFRRVPYRWAVMVLAVLAGGARIFVGVHYPADVVGGAVISLLVALMVCKSVNLSEPVIRKIFELYATLTARIPVLSAYRVYSAKQKKLYSQM